MTNHNNLLYFASTTLNRRQARWSIFLADYDFEIIFRPRIQHGKADALSRCSDLALCPGDDAYTQQSCSLLKPDQLQLPATFMLHDDSLLQEIAKATKTDTFATEIFKSLQDSLTAAKGLDLHHFTAHDGLLYCNYLLYVLEGSCRTQMLQTYHDDPHGKDIGVSLPRVLVTPTLEIGEGICQDV
jgi:hypothetical protein